MKVFNKDETLLAIKSKMETNGIGVRQVAKVMRTSVYNLSKKLNGEREFYLKELLILSEMLETDLNDLLKFDVI